MQENSGGSIVWPVEVKQFTFSYKEYKGMSLPSSYNTLLSEALDAADQAYCHYSKFSVGVSVKIVLTDGSTKIIQGSNQENLAYPSGICGERCALFHIGH